jgi:hypothetical protein
VEPCTSLHQRHAQHRAVKSLAPCKLTCALAVNARVKVPVDHLVASLVIQDQDLIRAVGPGAPEAVVLILHPRVAS